MNFEILGKDSKSSARAGKISTDHGDIFTPIFMPVGTAGTVKAVQQRDLHDEIQAQIILGNTYHLYLRPGMPILEQAGGLHEFMHWDKPILTDSGGYQVYSLADQRKIDETGVHFRSHIDGSKCFFSPEVAIDIQRSIGADIIMAFDECTPYPCEKDYARSSMHLTHRWLKRCVEAMERSEPKYGHEQVLFPIVQGSVFEDLRKESAEVIASVGAFGNAIGGLSVGEPHEEMYAMCEIVTSILPPDKPRYLMGVGTPANILENIALGIDMFDCVMPSRNARNGQIFTWDGIVNLRNKKWEKDFSPLDPKGTADVDSFYSRAYLRHLFVSGEMLGPQITTIHNLSFYLDLVKTAREHILQGDFASWKNQIVPQLETRL
jgi:queuine tRNA-ribosyltransferase